MKRGLNRNQGLTKAVFFTALGVAVERRLEGEDVEVADKKGWAWYELSKVDAARGGATRALGTTNSCGQG